MPNADYGLLSVNAAIIGAIFTVFTVFSAREMLIWSCLQTRRTTI
ncbi:MAG: hypothetical protein WB587_00640 [Nitrososphaeraceae archaeon]